MLRSQNQFESMGWLADYANCADQQGIDFVRYDDFERQSEQLVGFDQEYRQLSRGAFDGQFLSVDFGTGTSVHIEYANQALAQSMTAPLDCVSIGLVFDHRPYRVNGHLLTEDAVLVAPPGAELHFRSPEKGIIVAVCISTETFYTMTLGLDLYDFEPGQSATVLKAPAFAARARADVICALTKATYFADRAALGRIMATSILANLAAEIALRSERSERLTTNRHFITFKRAVAMSRSFENGPISLADLTNNLGLSARSVQTSFKAVVGCGPLEYLRLLRLCEARVKIAHGPIWGTSIGDVAARSGFCDWSHFSRLYKRQFGESPSQTRQRLNRTRNL